MRYVCLLALMIPIFPRRRRRRSTKSAAHPAMMRPTIHPRCTGGPRSRAHAIRAMSGEAIYVALTRGV